MHSRAFYSPVLKGELVYGVKVGILTKEMLQNSPDGVGEIIQWVQALPAQTGGPKFKSPPPT